MSDEPDGPRPDRADNGVDLTLIRELLAMTPAERLRHMVESANNLRAMLEKKRLV